MKAVHQTEVHTDLVPKIFERYSRLSERTDMHMAVFHEYFPLGKITSVGKDATAFRGREPKTNVMAFVLWAADTPEKFQFAKVACTELMHIASSTERGIAGPENIGYGNYSTCIDHGPRKDDSANYCAPV